MSVRTALLFVLLVVLLAAPASSIDVSGGIGHGGGTRVDAAADPGTEWSGHTATSPSSATLTSCSEVLRGFRVRNTLRPSKRRAAIRRCEEREKADGWAARPPAP